MVNPPREITDEPEVLTTFEDLGLRKELLSALHTLGYEEPTPIQRETIPLMIDGRDLIGQAATGTGKTAAFALPILQRLQRSTGKSAKPAVPMALVLVPTRELAMQVSEAIYKYGRDLGAKVLPIYGGQPIFRQLKELAAGVHVVVATPGRALDHIARNTLPLDDIEIVVLDEADEMLDMGFADDIEAILKATPNERQTVLFSATMPPRINSIAKRHLNDPLKIQIGLGDSKPGKQLVRQSVYIVQRSHKPAALGRILDVESPVAAIVFCRTRTEVDELTETMNGRGYRAESLHGGMTQEMRDKVMTRLRNGVTDLLVATDVAARGLDIEQLSHVVNYDVPSAPESYVHRIGRVGRAGRLGVAITLAEPREQRLLGNIERLTKQKISVEKVPTVADLRKRQIEITIGTIKEALAADDLGDYSGVLDALTGEHDMADIALAAIKLAHLATGATVDEREIPDPTVYADRKGPKGKSYDDRGRSSSYDDRGRSSSYDDRGRSGNSDDRGRSGGSEDRKPREFSDRGPRDGAARPRHENDGDVARIYIALGRKDGIRPNDLVGAIANESNLSGRQIGPISISDRFSVVGVPSGAVDTVLDALKSATIRGKATKSRRFSEE